jgi:hypothetical protein
MSYFDNLNNGLLNKYLNNLKIENFTNLCFISYQPSITILYSSFSKLNNMPRNYIKIILQAFQFTGLSV